MESYPIKRDKIETLKESIKTTGFWDNILARKWDGKIQIAYGHHRLVALREAMKPTDIVDIPVKALDDAMMIKIMARENSEEWRTVAAVIDETVAVAKKFLEEHPEEQKNYGYPDHRRIHQGLGRGIIARFLGWTETTIKESLQRLGMYDRDELDKESIGKFPTAGSAQVFTETVRRFKPTIQQQKKMVEKITESREEKRKPGEKPTYQEDMMEAAAVEVVHPAKKESAKQKQFEDHLVDIGKKIDSVIGDLDWILRNEQEFGAKFIDDSYERAQFINKMVRLIFTIKRFSRVKPKELSA
jgi:hypothetical protein